MSSELTDCESGDPGATPHTCPTGHSEGRFLLLPPPGKEGPRGSREDVVPPAPGCCPSCSTVTGGFEGRRERKARELSGGAEGSDRDTARPGFIMRAMEAPGRQRDTTVGLPVGRAQWVVGENGCGGGSCGVSLPWPGRDRLLPWPVAAATGGDGQKRRDAAGRGSRQE